MKVKTYKEMEGFENKHSIEKAVKLHDSEHTKIIHMTLKSGDLVHDHVIPVDVSFFVVEGEVEMKIGSEIENIWHGSLFESPANITHGFSNKSDSLARVLVIKHMEV